MSRCRRLLDLTPIETITGALGETSLAPLVAARSGLRVPGAWDGFEVAWGAVVGQQISVAWKVPVPSSAASSAGPVAPTAVEGAEPSVPHRRRAPGR